MKLTFDLGTIDWDAVSAIGTLLAVWVALHQSSSTVRSQRKRNAAMAGKVWIIFGRARDIAHYIARQLDAGGDLREVGEASLLVGGFEDHIKAADALSLADIDHPLVADELLRGRTALRNCQNALVRMAKGEDRETREVWATMDEAFETSQATLKLWQDFYAAPLWRRRNPILKQAQRPK